MNVFGIIIIVVLCLVLLIALFFELRGLYRSIKQYRSTKKQKEESKKADTKEDK